jgi:uncharacterized protein (TIGR02118 family)
MLKSVGFLVRKESMSHEEFVEYYRNTHVPLGKQLPNLQRYTTAVPQTPVEFQYRPAGELRSQTADVSLPPVDAVSELYFENRQDLQAAFESPAGRAVLNDEETFLKEVYYTLVEETVEIP